MHRIPPLRGLFGPRRSSRRRRGLVNSPPTITVPGAQSVDTNSTLIFSSGNGNRPLVDDADPDILTATYEVEHGTLAIGPASGSDTITDENWTAGTPHEWEVIFPTANIEAIVLFLDDVGAIVPANVDTAGLIAALAGFLTLADGGTGTTVVADAGVTTWTMLLDETAHEAAATRTIYPTTLVSGGVDGASVTLVGLETPINVAINGMIYAPETDFTGIDVLEISVDDGTNDPVTAEVSIMVDDGVEDERTTAQAGDWSNTATWTGGIVPTVGDTAVVNHNVTVDVDVIVGTSPEDDTTAVVTVASANLTVAAGKTLTMRGNFIGNGPVTNQLILSAGSHVVFDASAVEDDELIYALGLQTDNNVLQAFNLQCNGTAEAPCSLTQVGGAERFSITGVGFNQYGMIDATHTTFGCDFSAAGQFYALNGLPGDGNRAAPIIDMENCVIDGCEDCSWSGTYDVSNPPVIINSFVRLVNVTFRNSGANIPAISGTASHVLDGCIFDTQPNIRQQRAAITDCLFFGAFNDASGGSDPKSAFPLDGCLIRAAFTSPGPRRSDWSGCIVVNDGSTLDLTDGTYSAVADVVNPHWITPIGADGTYAVDHCVIEDFGSDGVGDIDYGPNIASLSSSFTYNIVLPGQVSDGNGQLNAGTMATINGFSGAACTYDHNTFYCGGQGFLALAEGGNGFADMVVSCRSNTVWNDARHASSGFNKILYQPTTPAGAVDDMVTPSAAGYNCVHNLNSAHSQTNSVAYYDTDFSSSAGVGANDVIADPQFVDITRNFSTWVTSIEGATLPGNGSPSRTDYNAYGLYKLSLRNLTDHADYDAAYTVAAYLTYVREGFRPTNESLRDAGHDGVTIGAVEMA